MNNDSTAIRTGNFNEIRPHPSENEGVWVGVGEASKLSNKFSKVGWYVEKTDNPEIFKVIERWEKKISQKKL